MTPREKITKAKAGLILDRPFWGSLVMRPVYRTDENCKTGWTDGKTIAYSSDFVNSLNLGQVKTFCAHEAGHNMLCHHIRRGNRNPKKWNMAGDYVVNGLLLADGFERIPGMLYNHAYDGMSTEAVYSMLPDDQEGDDTDADNDPGGCGEVRDLPGKDGRSPSPSEISQAEQEAKISTIQAAQQAKVMGNLPESVRRLVNDMLSPAVDWKEALRRFVDHTAKNDYTWQLPNRRFIGNDLYLPSLRSDNLGSIVVAVDTSGSVDQDMINQFAAELTAILQDYKTDCTVIYCDSEIANVEHFTWEDLPLKLSPAGGGGTNFNPPFAYVEENDLAPKCLIYLTDMAGEFPASAPVYPVLWGTIDADNEMPPFGETVKIR